MTSFSNHRLAENPPCAAMLMHHHAPTWSPSLLEMFVHILRQAFLPDMEGLGRRPKFADLAGLVVLDDLVVLGQALPSGKTIPTNQPTADRDTHYRVLHVSVRRARAQGGCAGLTSAHSDHRLVHPTIWTCDDDAGRSPSKSDGVVDLSVQQGHQLHAVLYHPLAPVFAGSRSHRLVFHQAAHSLSVEGGFA